MRAEASSALGALRKRAARLGLSAAASRTAAVLLASTDEACGGEAGDDGDVLVAAALFLAAKVSEDAPCALADVLAAFEPDAAAPAEPRVLACERALLRHLALDVHAESAHRHLTTFAHMLRCPPEAVRVAWAVLNDSVHEPHCRGCSPQAVACASLYLGAALTANADCFPSGPTPWWEVCGATSEEVGGLAESLSGLYAGSG